MKCPVCESEKADHITTYEIPAPLTEENKEYWVEGIMKTYRINVCLNCGILYNGR